jgi:hypothetical protein
MRTRPAQVGSLLITGGVLWLLWFLFTLGAVPDEAYSSQAQVQATFALLSALYGAGQLLLAAGLLLQVLAWYDRWRAGESDPEPDVDHYR